ncbi:MAG: hypothetical protein IPH07_03330 [Deltaproteobacteria bacterium]|nr:hypothetical protein [Deltaproteobacteria bacterium]
MSTTEESLFAQRAAAGALPYADLLAGRMAEIATALRDGRDQAALAALGDSTDDLEHFLRFLLLIQDSVGERSPDQSLAVRDYHEHILGILEGLQPALGHADLVEVADTLEDDLAPSLRSYRDLDAAVQSALSPP